MSATTERERERDYESDFSFTILRKKFQKFRNDFVHTHTHQIKSDFYFNLMQISVIARG